MDLRQLRYFVEVANAGGFKGAAARLHVSQSSVSRRIQDLEHELSVTLFERGVRGATLTEAGGKLLGHATVVLSEIQLARGEARGSSSPSGTVTVGTSLAMGSVLLSDLTLRIMSHFPEIKLLFAEGTQYQLADGLEAGRIDLAVMLDPRQIRNCAVHPLAEEALFWIRRPKAGRRPRTASLRDLDGVPLIMFPRPSAHRDMLDKAARLSGTSLNVRWEIANVATHKDFIRKDLANGILPFSAVSGEVSRHWLAATPLREVSLRHCLVVRNSREGSAAIGVVADTVKAIFQRMIERHAASRSIVAPSAGGWSPE